MGHVQGLLETPFLLWHGLCLSDRDSHQLSNTYNLIIRGSSARSLSLLFLLSLQPALVSCQIPQRACKLCII